MSEIENMLAKNVIDPAQTMWSAIVVFERKKGTLRIFADYRRRSATTVRDLYQLPIMDECLGCLGDIQTFSTLHVNSGY